MRPHYGHYRRSGENTTCLVRPSGGHRPEGASAHQPGLRGNASDTESPSPLFGDVLHTFDTAEPITAIFMGFQAAHDDSGWSHEPAGSMTAELVVIEDDEPDGEDGGVMERRGHERRGVEGFGGRQRQVGVDVRKKPCCSVS